MYSYQRVIPVIITSVKICSIEIEFIICSDIGICWWSFWLNGIQSCPKMEEYILFGY